MEYKYNLAQLQSDKEKVEDLISQQSQRVGQVFPKQLEAEFWTKNLERAQTRREICVGWGSGIFFVYVGHDSDRLLDY